MKESFAKVIKTLILPKYHEVSSFDIFVRDVTKHVHVTYKTPNGIKHPRGRELENDTISLFRMIGFSNEFTLDVWYGTIE
jgi:hypothetical protein